MNEGETISIKQDGDGFEEPDIVIVHPDDVPQLIKLLQAVHQEALQTFEGQGRAPQAQKEDEARN